MASWIVELNEEFLPEFEDLPEPVQDELLVCAELLAERGPELGRPHAATLKGSRYRNMKELRFKAANGVWRVAYAFDPERSAILLVAGNKSGVDQQRFYRGLIAKADRRFGAHQERLKER